VKILAVMVLVAAAVAGGYLLGGSCDSEGDRPAPGAADAAKTALSDLLDHRRQGSLAVREAFELVDRIVRGGEALVGPLVAALRDAPAWEYRGPPWSVDERNGVISSYPTRRVALLEALARIGGDRAIQALEEEARDRTPRTLIDRVAPVVFLARHAQRDDVRELFTELARKKIGEQREDEEMIRFLLAVRGRLLPEIRPHLAGAIATGWPQPSVAERMAHALHDLDPGQATTFFMGLLLDPKKPRAARRTAAWALARIPATRMDTLARLIEMQDSQLVNHYFAGLRKGRFFEEDAYRTALNSGDPETFSAYLQDRERDIQAVEQILVEVAKELGPKWEESLGTDEMRKSIEVFRASAARTLEMLRTAKGE
jgi:HEAT repeat protein